MGLKNISDKEVSFFIDRILSPVARKPWWFDIEGEDRQGKSGRFLSEEFASELSSEKKYQTRTDNNKLLFFSDKKTCAIDGKFNELGVELKCKDLSFKSLIDGAIHRGLLWVYGNPQNFTKKPKSISVFLLKKGAKPIKKELASVYFPILNEVKKYGVYIFFINQEGLWWGNFDDECFDSLPPWLSLGFSNTIMTPVNQSFVDYVLNHTEFPHKEYLYGRSNKYIFNAADYKNGKVARMEWWNHMQMLEIGLLLRAKGFGAVKIGHDQSIEGQKNPAGYGVEKRVKNALLNNHGIFLDWKNTL